MPADLQEIEVIRGESRKVFFGLRNVSEEDTENYELRLRYNGYKLAAGKSIDNLNHLLTLDVGSCISHTEGTRCTELEVTLFGDDILNNETINLVVMKYGRHPVLNIEYPMDRSANYASQNFTIKIVGKLSIIVTNEL